MQSLAVNFVLLRFRLNCRARTLAWWRTLRTSETAARNPMITNDKMQQIEKCSPPEVTRINYTLQRSRKMLVMRVYRLVDVSPSRGSHLSVGKTRPSPYSSCNDREYSRVACLQHRYVCTTRTSVLSCSEWFEHHRRLRYELVPDAGASHLRLGFIYHQAFCSCCTDDSCQSTQKCSALRVLFGSVDSSHRAPPGTMA